MRNLTDAILVGARTVAIDDPRLTTRLVRGRGRDPLRVILDGKLAMSPAAKALPALVVTTEDAPERPDLEARGAEIVRIGRGVRVPLLPMLEMLGRRGIVSLLVEGGGDVHGQLLEGGWADRMTLFIAPKLIGQGGVPLLGVEGPKAMGDAWRLERISTRRLGDDILVSGYVVRRA